MAGQTATTPTWAQTAALNPRPLICLSCGGELAPPLARLGSLRCHTCRELDAPLNPRLVRPPKRRPHALGHREPYERARYVSPFGRAPNPDLISRSPLRPVLHSEPVPRAPAVKPAPGRLPSLRS